MLIEAPDQVRGAGKSGGKHRTPLRPISSRPTPAYHHLRLDAARLPAEPVFLFQNSHIVTTRSEQSGACQPAYACSDDHNARDHILPVSLFERLEKSTI